MKLQKNINKILWNDVETLIVDKNRCCGCGVCQQSCPINGCITIVFDNNGEYKPIVKHEVCINCGKCVKVCPDDYTDYYKIVNMLINNNELIKNKYIGNYKDNYVGYVAESEYRINCASGGLLSAFLTYLFQEGKIDGAVVSAPCKPSKGKLFEIKIARSVEEIMASRGSKYYPHEYSKAIAQVKKSDGKFAIVGTPCSIYAMRKLEKVDKHLKGKILFYLSLFCGHNVSTSYTRYLFETNKVNYDLVKKVEYRDKKDISNAINYNLKIDLYNDVKRIPFFNSNIVKTWTNYLFALNKCLYCTDFSGELADISFGDAWLPEYINDVKGTSIVTVRSKKANNILRKMNEKGIIDIKKLSVDRVIESQKEQINFKKEEIKSRIAFNKIFNKNFPDYNVDWCYKDYFKCSGRINSLILRVYLSKVFYRYGVLVKIETKTFVYLLRPLVFVKDVFNKIKIKVKFISSKLKNI